MITGRLLFDVTKASRQKHKSGLARVSACLRREMSPLLGDRFIEVEWSERASCFKPRSRVRDFEIQCDDVFLTSELFCEYERPGFEAFLSSKACSSYVIFHDAIPLQHPEFTWPHSVQRHPSYMKMLSKFTGAFAVSQHSAILLEEYWEWLGFEYSPSVKSIQLGSDGFFLESSSPKTSFGKRPQVLIIAILEKRKGQDLALEACKILWDEGIEFDLHLVGRANPYFGKDIEKALKQAIRSGYPIHLYGQIEDTSLQTLLEKIDLTLFPTRAEGCGLPVLESLWRGIPTLCSGLASIKENARFGGCRLFEPENVESLASSLRGLVLDQNELQCLGNGIKTEILPRWRSTVEEILNYIKSESPSVVSVS